MVVNCETGRRDVGGRKGKLLEAMWHKMAAQANVVETHVAVVACLGHGGRSGEQQESQKGSCEKGSHRTLVREAKSDIS